MSVKTKRERIERGKEWCECVMCEMWWFFVCVHVFT